MNNPVNIVLADDHPYFRSGFRETLESFPRFKVKGEASNGMELLGLCNKLQPELVITDLMMPVMDGTSAIAALRKLKYPPVIIALTAVENDADRYATLVGGAKGYLHKAVRRQELQEAIETVIDSDHYYCCFDNEELNGFLKKFNYPNLPKRHSPFTSRELEVWHLLKDEKTSADIGRELFISPQAIKYHRNNLLKKTGAKNTVGLILYGLKHKILKLKDQL